MKKHIFIVEDDASIRVDFSELLTFEDYTVEAYANGKEGMDGLQSTRSLPDLILLDLMMPIMNGYQFLDEIEKLPAFRSIPILVISADRDARQRLEKHPWVNFMKKPLELETF